MAKTIPTWRRRLAEIVGGVSVSHSLSMADILYGWVRVPPARASWEFLLAFRSSPLLRMLTATVMNGIADVDWYVGTQTSRGIKRIPDHPLTQLLTRGNDLLTGHEVKKLTAGHFKVVGEAHWLLERNALGVPVGIVPLVPTWIISTPRPGRMFYDVAVTEGGFVGRIAASEIITFRDLDLYRPYDRGTGLALALDNDLSADQEAARYTNAYLANNARPDLIVSANTKDGAQGLTKEEAKGLEAAWLDKFKGPEKRGLPLIAAGDITVTELGKTNREMQFVELRKFERDLCISVFGIPPEMVGVLQSSNRATALVAQAIFCQQVLVPILNDMRAIMQVRLAPQFDPRLIIDYDDPTPDDAAHRQMSMKDRPWAFNIDEHREEAGNDPLPNGEGQFYPIPQGFTFERDFKTAQTPEPKPGETPPAKAKAAGDLDEEDIAAILSAADPLILTTATDPVLRSVIQAFGADSVSGFGISFDMADPAVVAYIQSYGADRVTGLINETTRNNIRSAISDTVSAGGTQDDIIAAIGDVFVEASDSRAANIAATETNAAANFATVNAYDQAGIPGKEWLSTRDSSVRDTDEASHVELDGQQKPTDEDFVDPVSGAQGPHPGGFGDPAEDCRCRCGVIPVEKLDENQASGMKDSSLDTEEKRVAAWKAIDRHKRSFERVFAIRVKTAFAKQSRAVIRVARHRMSA